MPPLPPLAIFGRRIMVCGPSNAGKSTLAVAIGNKLRLPAKHIDQFRHRPGTDWEVRPDAEFAALHDEAIAADDWVIDGNYTNILPQRLERATGIILLADHRLANLWRYCRRSWFERERAGGLHGNRDSVKWEMITWILIGSPRSQKHYKTLLPATGLPFVQIDGMAALKRAHIYWQL